jgi:hypothetical protein
MQKTHMVGGTWLSGKAGIHDRRGREGREKSCRPNEAIIATLVQFVNDYFKWFVCRGIAKRVSEWDWELRKKCEIEAVVGRETRKSVAGRGLSLAGMGRDKDCSGEKKMKKVKTHTRQTRVWGTRVAPANPELKRNRVS